MMIEDEDNRILAEKGISQEAFERQLKQFETGFPFMKVKKAAVPSDGIVKIDEKGQSTYLKEWKEYLTQNKKIVKFVPASGAASRMFKGLFAFLAKGENELSNSIEKEFFDHISQFAFYEELNFYCKRNEGWDIPHLVADKKYLSVVENLLSRKGLNYGELPKGLLLFHKYNNHPRTPFEEHMVEGALYAKNAQGDVNLHFTVSPEHLPLFEKTLKARIDDLSYQFGANYHVEFSMQNPSTDTVAVDTNNQPFRENGKILFRPGGHGSLIENLNNIDADVIFIKNIDNVSPDAYKQPTITTKMFLAGLLVNIQKTLFEYQELLETASKISDEAAKKILKFTEEKLGVSHGGITLDTNEQITSYLKKTLFRPLRICGMVENEGEPGGGPYLCQNPDGTISAQILESSQFDTNDPKQMEIMKNATHFNPVDLVCATKNYKGEKYNLLDYVDENTGFISMKSKNGRDLKALERPGLWNGAMSDWNTIFVEVPIETFTPVKVVTDLLREEHQTHS